MDRKEADVIVERDSSGHFVKGNVPWNKYVKREHVQVICPACGQQVEVVAGDGRVKGYCGVAKQYVDFQIEIQLVKKKWQDPKYRAKHSAAMKKRWQDPEYRAKQSATSKRLWQDPEYRAKVSAVRTRDSSGHFVKGNVP